jgi:hypothetical protein
LNRRPFVPNDVNPPRQARTRPLETFVPWVCLLLGTQATLTGHVRTWAEHDAVLVAALMAGGVIDVCDEQVSAL